jgi:hypothetical protein
MDYTRGNHMNLRCRIAVLAFGAVCCASASLSAQSLARFSTTLSMDVLDYDRDGMSNDPAFFGLSIAARTYASRNFGLVVVANAGATKQVGGEDALCTIDPAGGCKIKPPGFRVGSLQLGAAYRTGPLTFAVLTGPSVMSFAAQQKVGPQVNGYTQMVDLPATTLGAIHTRAEAAAVVWQNVGVVFSSTWRHVPNFRGEVLNIKSLGLVSGSTTSWS